MGLKVSALAEKLRSSLFFVPTLLVILGAGLARAMIAADSAIGDDADDLPFVLTSTVASAREVLGVVASATITVAGIAFSVSCRTPFGELVGWSEPAATGVPTASTARSTSRAAPDLDSHWGHRAKLAA